MDLNGLVKNQSARITGYNILDKNLQKRLYDIGIRINSEITVVKKGRWGAIIISVSGRQIILSRELSSKVLVKVENEV